MREKEKVLIDSYSFGSMFINGKEYTDDLIVFPDRIKTNWWRKEGHSLAIEDLKEVFEFQPDILIIGQGDSSLMKIPPETKKEIENQGIELIAKETSKAYKIFNEKIKQGKKVVGAFHLTC